MSVRSLKAKQRGPRCSYCTERAKWRGLMFRRFACSEHHGRLVAEDQEQSRRDAYQTGAAAARARKIASAHPNEWPAAELADLYEALAWWQHPIRSVARIIRAADLERLPHPRIAQRAA